MATPEPSMSLRHLALLLPALALCACGDKSDDEDEDGDDTASSGLECMANITASGAVDADISYGAEEGCSGSGLDDAASFSWGLSTDYTVFLWINSGVDADAGSQSGLVGTVGLMDSDYNEWQSISDACEVEITSMEPDPDWEGSIWFTGTATCADPLVSEGGDEVTVGELSFRGSAPMGR
jgi:hypothetical protein